MNKISNAFSVDIQISNFNYEREYLSLIHNNNIGAVVCFCGLVRDFLKDKYNNQQAVKSITIECYTEMAKKVIYNIILKAKKLHNIKSAKVIHRFGVLYPGEQIVFVGVSSTNRHNSFLACEYIINYLKVYAPFWKKENTNEGSFWVEQKNSDLKRCTNI